MADGAVKRGPRFFYHLPFAGAKNRAIVIAVGTLAGKKALFALTAAGLEVFDGAEWHSIANAPERGRTIAVRKHGNGEVVFIAGAQGVRAGSIDAARKWKPVDAPDARFASVHGGTRASGQMLFVTSRQQREILVGEPSDTDWNELTLPLRNAEVSSVVPDPFTPDRFYVGTLGEGVLVFEGKPRRFVAREKDPAGGGVQGGPAGSR